MSVMPDEGCISVTQRDTSFIGTTVESKLNTTFHQVLDV